jgi:REP element-mobilizing transposase RayT
MPQSLSDVLLHIVFFTKDRYPFLVDQESRKDLCAYLAGILINRECPPIEIGGTRDHVHILCSLARTESISSLVGETKRASSIWAKGQYVTLQKFAWQKGYGVFSVSSSQKGKAVNYIRGQEEHHRKMSFQEEYRLFLDRHGIEYDERYVWE